MLKYILIVPVFILIRFELRAGLKDGYEFLKDIAIIAMSWLILSVISMVIELPLLLSLFFLFRGLIFSICLLQFN